MSIKEKLETPGYPRSVLPCKENSTKAVGMKMALLFQGSGKSSAQV